MLEQVGATALPDLMAQASALRRKGHGEVVTYSRKVFIPLTRLCRDVCGYCTFAKAPRDVAAPYLSVGEVLGIAQAGKAASCKEALFTLGDKPELRYAAARDWLTANGFSSTLDYVAHAARKVFATTGLFPHINAGVMDEADILRLRDVSVSQGLMLESTSDRLGLHRAAHAGAPDKTPAARLATIAAAGRAGVPFTSGILIGIGETRLERVEALLALRDLHREFGHVQEVIIQNFRAKPGTRMAQWPEPSFDDLLWTAAVARLIFGPAMNIQTPPNLSDTDFPKLLDAGINDWGGISPVTPDHVNPEKPWPQIEVLRAATEAAGFALAERLAVYPAYAQTASQWQTSQFATAVRRASDADGLARTDGWSPGQAGPPPDAVAVRRPASPGIGSEGLDGILHRAQAGERLDENAVVLLFSARGPAAAEVCGAADALRAKVSGDTVRYVVNRNINYTNVCVFSCRFCAFSKGATDEDLRGRPYDLALDEVARRTREAWDRGATEVCMQGGINPHYTGDTYLQLVRAVKEAAPGLHVHAFSPLEVSQGASTLGITVAAFLERLRDAGLGSLPGTAAEILDDEVRAVICPDKLSTREWLDVIETAHRVGLPTTSTIMFGHVETPRAWARHLLALRDLQSRTGGITEFVPLPFVHMEAPEFLRGRSRPGPTWRETLLMHAVARLALHPLIPNIQASWVKLGPQGVARVLAAGANDVGGTLMNESISRAAGTQHGQEWPPEAIEATLRDMGRDPAQRTTLYDGVPSEQTAKSFAAAPLTELVLTPFSSRRAERAAVPAVTPA